MPADRIVRRVLLLQTLLASLDGLVFGLPYEFGYHPSAEEFDSLLRDTRAWSQDLLGSERRRLWHHDTAAAETEAAGNFPALPGPTLFMASANERYFVPKFNNEQTRQHSQGLGTITVTGTNTNTNRRPQFWQSHVQKIDRPAFEQLDDGLAFQMFSDERAGEQNEQPSVYESVHNTGGQSLSLPVEMPPAVQVTSGLIEVNEPNKHLPPLSPVSVSASSPAQVNDDNANRGNFPIFFTNPATGIVYAITEVGKVQDNQTSFSTPNPTIPIYITKAQYDSDIEALRQRYQASCQIVRRNTTMATTTISTTARPQIIRLPRPAHTTTVSKLPTGKHPVMPNIHHQRPKSTPVPRPRPTLTLTPLPMQANVAHNVKLPTPTKPSTRRPITQTQTSANAIEKPKKKRRKKKKNHNRNGNNRKRPGRKPSTPSIVMPQIMLGTRRQTTVGPETSRKPAVTANSHLATQLERPNVPPQPPATATATAITTTTTTRTTSVFGERPLVATSGYFDTIPKQLRAVQLQKRHRMRRRSVSLTVGPGELAERAARKISTSPRRRRKQNKSNPSRTSRVDAPNSHNRTVLAPSAVHLLHRRHNGTDAIKANVTTLTKANAVAGNAVVGKGVTDQATVGKAVNITKPRGKSKRNPGKRRGASTDQSFNLFDLVDIGADDDDDDDDDGDDYDADDAYYYDDKSDDDDHVGNKKKKRPTEKKKKPEETVKLEQDLYTDYPTAESLADLKEEIPEDNSSSPEESADFGAMEEEPTPTVIYASLHKFKAETNNTTNTKSSLGKKRIRRRPPPSAAGNDASSSGASDEDYDDDDDSMASSSIGGFFRMIFYPVQVAMSRFFDGFNGAAHQDDDDDNEESTLSVNKVRYPTYTLYNNAINQAGGSSEAGDDSDDDSLGSWFSSLFGLQRKTKKIGSTTVAPLMAPAPAPPPTTTAEPGWLETWFGFGKATEPADNEGSWFFSWFDAKPKTKAQRRTTTSTTTSSTTTTTAMPQVPILTIVDPMRNPQNWIGILAHHIVNATTTTTASSTTHNPLIDALMTRVTSATTTDNPDIPRRISYEKYQIWRLKPQDEAQVRTLEEVKKSDDGVKMQWLKGPSLRGLTDVLVPPKILIDFQGTLNFEGIAHEVLIFDVGKAIAYEQSKEDYFYTTPKSTHRRTNQRPSNTTTKPPAAMTWHKYYEYDDIIKYLETIRMRHAQLVELIHIGRSYEGRPLIVVKIESKKTAAGAASASADSVRKKLKYKRKSVQANAVFIEAGAHGLAWIGPAAATWIINELIRLMRTNKSDPDADFIRNTTWYIMPVLNPDGYVYSHEYDRFWKKSRSRHLSKASGGLLNSAMTWLQQKKTGNRICHGVDLDRNWQYHWGKRGSSKSPCNEFYAGPTPFSEPETKALSEFLMDYRTQIKLYISMQAYGQVISYPIKANSTFNMERMDDFLDVAMVGTDGLRKKGSKTRYKVDSANDLIEHRSGCSDAFAAYEIGIPFSYTLQLADNGVHGYLLPSSSIEPTAHDAFEIISGMLDYI